VYTQEEFAQTLEKTLGVRAFRFRVPRPVLTTAALGSELYGKLCRRPVMLTRDKLNELEAPHVICSSRAFQDEIGWKPETSLEDGARRTVEWYRSNGWL